jgi:hypothetical protein
MSELSRRAHVYHRVIQRLIQKLFDVEPVDHK